MQNRQILAMDKELAYVSNDKKSRNYPQCTIRKTAEAQKYI